MAKEIEQSITKSPKLNIHDHVGF